MIVGRVAVLLPDDLVGVGVGGNIVCFKAEGDCSPGVMVEMVDDVTVRPVSRYASVMTEARAVAAKALEGQLSARTERPCPTCERKNDVGVTNCWWCEGKL